MSGQKIQVSSTMAGLTLTWVQRALPEPLHLSFQFSFARTLDDSLEDTSVMLTWWGIARHAWVG